MGTTLVLANLGLAASALLAWIQFGSIASALGYLRGERLVPDAYKKSFGEVQSGQTPHITFYLTNYSNRPISIIGCKVSCDCTWTTSLPMEVLPRITVSFDVDVRTRSLREGILSNTVLLYTEGDGPREILLTMTGRVLPLEHSS